MTCFEAWKKIITQGLMNESQNAIVDTKKLMGAKIRLWNEGFGICNDSVRNDTR